MLPNTLVFMYGLIKWSHNPIDNFTHMSISFNYELLTCFFIKGGNGVSVSSDGGKAARFPSDC